MSWWVTLRWESGRARYRVFFKEAVKGDVNGEAGDPKEALSAEPGAAGQQGKGRWRKAKFKDGKPIRVRSRKG